MFPGIYGYDISLRFAAAHNVLVLPPPGGVAIRRVFGWLVSSFVNIRSLARGRPSTRALSALAGGHWLTSFAPSQCASVVRTAVTGIGVPEKCL